MRDGGGVERALPLAADTHHGAVGPARVHPRAAALAGHAAPPLPRGPAPEPLVSISRQHALTCGESVALVMQWYRFAVQG